MDIQGKVALVTGAGYGIGRGIAKRLAAERALVIVDDIHGEHGPETVALIERAGGKAAYMQADVTRDDDVRRMIGFAEEKFGGLDVLVNNAGSYYDPPYYPEADPANWQAILDIFLRSYMSVMRHAMSAMRRRGGVIVNISSAAGVGFRADSDWPDYAAAKAAVVRLTVTLAPLQEQLNIRVNCICPGWVATERVLEYLSRWTAKQKAAANVPERMLTPEDIGDAVVQCARDENLAGRVMLYYEPGKKRLIPTDLDLFALSEEA